MTPGLETFSSCAKPTRRPTSTTPPPPPVQRACSDGVKYDTGCSGAAESGRRRRRGEPSRPASATGTAGGALSIDDTGRSCSRPCRPRNHISRTSARPARLRHEAGTFGASDGGSNFRGLGLGFSHDRRSRGAVGVRRARRRHLSGAASRAISTRHETRRPGPASPPARPGPDARSTRVAELLTPRA